MAFNCFKFNIAAVFLCRQINTGASLPSVAALCKQADEQLLRSMKYTPILPLRRLITM